MAVLRTNLRILWDHIMKNIQVNHGPCDTIIIRKLWVIIRPLPCWQQDSLLLADFGIYAQVYHRTVCPAVLMFKVRGPIKNKGGVGLFQTLQQERLFHLLWQSSALGDNLTMWSPFLHLPKKAFLSSWVWQRKNISGHSIGRRVYWFVLKISRVFPVPTGRVGIGWWTLL